jgi:hypothetical protein
LPGRQAHYNSFGIVAGKFLILFSVCACCMPALGQYRVPMRPCTVVYGSGGQSQVDLGFLHDAPAGKEGFIRIKGGHFVKPDGTRIRFWGVHLTDWSPGSVLLPPKEEIPMWAGTLARYGVNCVRLHFLDLAAPRGIIDASRDDTRSFDPQQLDRLDFLVSQLKRLGIYVDLNLNVGRSYKAGDGVVDFDKIRWGKGLILFDPRLIALQKEYAEKLLTHVNPYTGMEYRDDPVVAIVEIANENGIGIGFRAPTPYYDEELTSQYNAWLADHLNAYEIQQLRKMAGVTGGAALPRLKPSEVASAPEARYRAEMAFYMYLENRFFEEMNGYLKGTLGVKSPVIGTADHAHSHSSYPLLASLSRMDLLDGHVYWEHPGGPPPFDTPMVNDPLHSTVVQLSRTALAGKPFTVSETNHPFPNEWASEGIPIIASYGAFQDWDAIITYTFEPKREPNAMPYIGDAFDISYDPVKMAELAAGALIFLRGDVEAARRTVERTYSLEQVIDSARLPYSDWPYFTPGFPLQLPLEHEVRIGSLDGPPTAGFPQSLVPNPICSDTRQLAWYTMPAEEGVVTVDTPRTQALVGFIGPHPKTLTNLSAQIENRFATLVLTSMDGRPLSVSSRMLLTAGSRVANTGMKWNEAHTRLVEQGVPPTLIEPVTGRLELRGLQRARGVQAEALDGAGHILGQITAAKHGEGAWTLPIGEPATTWYVISVRR